MTRSACWRRMLPTDDVDWAVAEMQRLARKGIRTVCIYTDVKPHMPPYRDRYYDPLWAASVDLDMRSRSTSSPGRCVTPSPSSTITSAIRSRG